MLIKRMNPTVIELNRQMRIRIIMRIISIFDYFGASNGAGCTNK